MQESEKEKCFVMMPISNQGDYPDGHFTKVYQQIFKPAIEEAGYEPYRVDENIISDSIIVKIFDAIQTCPMAICDLSNRNPNVLYELGLRQAYDKPVVLLQDDKTEGIFDVSGISTVYYKSNRLYENVVEAKHRITEAIIATRDGNTNTLAKIIKANMAIISTEAISENDRLDILLRQVLSSVNEIKSDLCSNKKKNNKTTIQRQSSWDGKSKKIEYVVPRPNKGIEEMVEISQWAREQYAPYVDVYFDDLFATIEITGCEIYQADLIASEIQKVMGI